MHVDFATVVWTSRDVGADRQDVPMPKAPSAATTEAREEHAKRARTTRSTLDQIERLSGLLSDLAGTDPNAR